MIELLDRRWGDCRLCKMLKNPYYAPAAYLARVAVNFATVIWATLALLDSGAENAKLYIHYRQMLSLMPVKYWAAIALSASGFGIYRLLHRNKPAWWGAIGYWALMIFWVYVGAAIVLVDMEFMTPVGVSGIVTVSFLSIYAAASHSQYLYREPV